MKYHKVLLMGILFTLSVIVLRTSDSQAAIAGPGPATIEPAEGQKQTLTIPVLGISPANPAIYWTQLDDGSFTAESEKAGSKVFAPMGGDNSDPYPSGQTYMRSVIDMSPYKPVEFLDANKTKYARGDILDAMISAGSSEWKPGNYNHKPEDTAPNVWSGNGEYIDINVATGGPNWDHQDKTSKNRPNGQPKWLVGYDIPMTLGWKGTVKQTKEIELLKDQEVKVGDTGQLEAFVTTTGYQPSTGKVDVTYRPTTTWSTSDSNIVTVGYQGEIYAKAKGTAKVTVKFTTGPYVLMDTVTIAVGELLPGGDTSIGGYGQIKFDPENTMGMQPPIVRDWSRKDVPVHAYVVNYQPVRYSKNVIGEQAYRCGIDDTCYRPVIVKYIWVQEADIDHIKITGDAEGINNVVITKEDGNMKLHGEVQWLPGEETWILPPRTTAIKPDRPATPPPITGDSGIYRVDKTKPIHTINITKKDWTNQPIVVNIKDTDNVSGFFGTKYDVTNISYYGDGNMNATANDKDKLWNPIITIAQQGVYVIKTTLGDWAGWPEILPDGPQTYVYTDYRYDAINPYPAEFQLGNGGIDDQGKFDYIVAKNNTVKIRVGDELSGVVKTEFSWSKSPVLTKYAVNGWKGEWNEIPVGTPDYATGSNQMSEWVSLNIDSKDQYDKFQATDYDDMKEGTWYLHIKQTDRAGNVTQTVSPKIFINKIKNLRVNSVADFSWKSLFMSPTGEETGLKTNGIGTMDMPIYSNKQGKNVSLGYGADYKFDVVGFDGEKDKIVLKMDYHGIDKNGVITSFHDVFVEDAKGKFIKLPDSEYSGEADLVTFSDQVNAGKRKLYEATVDLNKVILPMYESDTDPDRYKTIMHRTFLPPTTKFVLKGRKLDLAKGTNMSKYKELVTFTIEGYREGHSLPLRYTFMEDRWAAQNMWGTSQLNAYGKNRPTGKDLLGLGVNHGEVIWFNLQHTLKDDLKYFREW
jgi:hypothetical protein